MRIHELTALGVLILSSAAAHAATPPPAKDLHFDSIAFAGKWTATQCEDSIMTPGQLQANTAYVGSRLDIALANGSLSVKLESDADNEYLSTSFDGINRGPLNASSGGGQSVGLSKFGTVESYTFKNGIYKVDKSTISLNEPNVTSSSKAYFEYSWMLALDADGNGFEYTSDHLYKPEGGGKAWDQVLRCHYVRAAR